MGIASHAASMAVGLMLLPSLLANCWHQAGEPGPRILFVGNSLSSWNGGVDRYVALLAASTTPPRHLHCESVYRNGATLKYLWQQGEVRQRLGQTRFDLLVLQDDLPEMDPASGLVDFAPTVRQYADLVRPQHTRTVLFAAWPYARLGWISGVGIQQAHGAAAAAIQGRVAPVGLAMAELQRQAPDLTLLQEDGEHPNQVGTYLAALVLHATLFPADAASSTWVPPGIGQERAALLKRIALAVAKPAETS